MTETQISNLLNMLKDIDDPKEIIKSLEDMFHTWVMNAEDISKDDRIMVTSHYMGIKHAINHVA